MKRTDTGARLRLATDCLRVEVDKASRRVEAFSPDGGPVMADAAPARRTARGFLIERTAFPAEMFFGLGPKAAAEANLRGQQIAAARGFLVSSLGYGEFFPLGSGFSYDLARATPGRRTVTVAGAGHLEYFIHHGPTPREVFSEHAAVKGTFAGYDAASLAILGAAAVPPAAARIGVHGPGSWKSLAESVRSLVHAAWSGLLLPAVDLSPYEAAPEPLFRRAAQLAVVAPVVYTSAPRGRPPADDGLAQSRAESGPYLLLSCGYEAREFGVPVIRPVAMQSPGDMAAAGSDTSEFMVGDALLVAPVFSPSAARSVCLPAGRWTRLRTLRRYAGRQRIEIQAEPDEVPPFAKHIAVLPMRRPGHPDLLVLHYFAGGAAECLLAEEDAGGLSQFHAAPAGDRIRREILSVRTRTWEWAIHHAAPPSHVAAPGQDHPETATAADLKPGRWFQDRPGHTVRIQTTVEAGRERILHAGPFSPNRSPWE